jgi:hypothetical protein
MASNNPSQNNYFPSKRDWWIVGLIWVGVVVSVVGGIVPLVLTGASWTKLVLMASLFVVMDSLMLWVLYGTGYTITADQLFIRCGPLSFRVRLDSIERIFPTRCPWSSPACSLDRLRIVYGLSQQSLMVSPVDKPGFLSAIAQQCPTLIVLHDRVRRKTDSSSSPVDPMMQPQVIA